MKRRTSRRLRFEPLEPRTVLTTLLGVDAPPMLPAEATLVQAEGEGFVRGSISGKTFADQDQDGTQDTGDPGLAGQRVYLDLNKNGARESSEPLTATNQDGSFTFDDLGLDTYVVALETAGAGALTQPLVPQFGAAVHLSTGDGTSSVAIADFNGDGREDLVATNGGENSIYLGLRNDTAGFDEILITRLDSQRIGVHPIDVVVADFDGDGKPDVAAAMVTSREFNVLLSSGSAAPAENFPTTCEAIADATWSELFPVICSVEAPKLLTSIDAADLDDDGDVDVVISAEEANGLHGIQVFENDGSGNFRTVAELTTGTRPQALVITELLPDAGPEIAIVHRGERDQPGSVSVVPLDGLLPVESGLTTLGDASVGARDIAAADLDEDGRNDLVVANAEADEITVYWWNESQAEFEQITLIQNFAATSIAVGDVDGDSDPDLVVTNGLEEQEIILIENLTPQGERPSFADAVTIGSGGLEREFNPSVALADFNGDMRLDVAVANGSQVESGGGVSLIPNLLGTHEVDVSKGIPNHQISFGISANSHHNLNIPLDVNADETVSPVDALIVINYLNEVGSSELSLPNETDIFIDTNNDRFAAPADALIVINHLNEASQSRTTRAQASSEGQAVPEGENEDSTLILPSDFAFREQWALHNDDDTDIDAVEAWDITTGRPEVVVAVIDSGIDLSHPDLYLNVWINEAEIPPELRQQLQDVDADGLITFRDLNHSQNSSLVSQSNANDYVDAFDLLQDERWVNGLDDDGNTYPDDLFGPNFLNDNVRPIDDSGHGTHVSGIIAAIQDNGRGISGVSPNVRLLPIKVLDRHNQSDDSEDIAEGIEYARKLRERGVLVPVINASWQTPTFDEQVLDEIAAAAEANILFVTVAGNADSALGPKNLDEVQRGHYPARYDVDNVVAVASVDMDGQLSFDSHFGPKTIDIAAPGVDIVSTSPDESFKSRNGTSMAAAFVSGTAALLWSRAPEATVATVIRALTEGVDELDNLEGKVATGGRLNAYRALLPTFDMSQTADVNVGSAVPHRVELEIHSIVGVDNASLSDADITVRRQGSTNDLAVSLVGFVEQGGAVSASYHIQPPGGTWDAADKGVYNVFVNAGEIRDVGGQSQREQRQIGNFAVEVADGQVFRVDSFRDAPDLVIDGTSDDGTGRSTLRSAVMEANAAGNATIVLKSGRYPLTISSSGEDGAVAGDLDVFGDLTIVGEGINQTIIDASEITDRLFDVQTGAKLTLVDLRLTGGRHESKGGAIWSRGALELVRVESTRNRAHRGGAVYSQDDGHVAAVDSVFSDNHAIADGGAIVSEALLDVMASSFNNNTANNGGAIFAQSGDGTVRDSQFMGNQAVVSGGAIRSNCGLLDPCSLHFENTKFERNQTGGTGGAIYVNGQGLINLTVLNSDFEANEAHSGGGILEQSETTVHISVDRSTFTNNRASSEGGAINSRGHDKLNEFLLTNSQVTHNMAGTQAAGVYTNRPFRVVDSVISHNTAGGTGGGFYNDDQLVVIRTDVDANHADGNGGGIHTAGNPGNRVEVYDSTITRNSTNSLGAGLTAFGYARIERTLVEGNVSTDDAGGINLYGGSDVIDSTIINNVAAEGGGVFTWNEGHRIENTLIANNISTNVQTEGGGGIFNGGELFLTNVTISGNEAENIGGAIFNKAQGRIHLSHVTLVGNSADSWGAIYNRDGVIRADNTIFATNVGDPDLELEHLSIDLRTHNVVDNVRPLGRIEVGTGNLLGSESAPIDTLLGPLQDNGGQTLTHALLPGSPAIDAADLSGLLTTDQRGFDRPTDGDLDGEDRPDIGAFEL